MAIWLFCAVPPRFDGDEDTELDPENLHVIQNDTIILSCPAESIPPPQITWYKNGDELVEDDLDDRITILNDGRELEISVADVDDTARYTCVARNLAGELEKNFDLDVDGMLILY